jgi:HPt (histidine-containing phosphotransfer) domain-containing protein
VDDGLDEDVLAGLRDLASDTGPDLLADLVAMFLHDARTRVQELREALAAEDVVALAAASHTIKGSAANLGARRLAGLAAEMEALSGNGGLAGRRRTAAADRRRARPAAGRAAAALGLAEADPASLP